MIPFIQMSRRGKSIETESRVASGWGKGEGRVPANGYKVSLGDGKKCLELGSSNGCTVL